MLAIALSGAGNRGPLQVGALQVLFERGIWPDMFVGTSAGALNAAYLAAHNDPGAIEGLIHIWRTADKFAIYPGNFLSLAWRLLAGHQSLYPSDGLRRLIEECLPSDVTTFADLKKPCYVTTSDLTTSRLYLFPDSEECPAPIVDAVLASSSVPVIHPPVLYAGRQLVDGGIVDNVPASVAIEKGATLVYVLNAGYGGDAMDPVMSITDMLGRVLDTFQAQSLYLDLDWAIAQEDVILHHIHLPDFEHVTYRDFAHVDEMIEAGRQRAIAYLDHPQPRQAVDQLQPHLAAPRRPAPDVEGADPYVPPYRRGGDWG